MVVARLNLEEVLRRKTGVSNDCSVVALFRKGTSFSDLADIFLTKRVDLGCLGPESRETNDSCGSIDGRTLEKKHCG